MTLIRVLVADDSDFVRRGVVELVSAGEDLEVCGEARTGEEAIQKARELNPDVALLDIRMPGLNGLDVARLLRRDVPAAKIVMMSHHDPAILLPSAIEAGAHACVDKGRLAADLVSAIRRVSNPSTLP